jgi:hypothetical protein
MPARIVETKPRPFKRVDVDPISLDIIENSMLNARWEMDAVLFRTAMSPGIREQHDEFPHDRQRRRQDGRRPVRQLYLRLQGRV